MSPGGANYYGAYFLTYGQELTVDLYWTPTGTPMDVGLCNPYGSCTGTQVSGGSSSSEFWAHTTGYFYVYVANASYSQTVDYYGSVNY